MASALIHMCVAKKVGERIGKGSKDYYLGSIAPDISKQVGMTKKESHFLYNTDINVPNIKMFLEKYKSYIKSDKFILGYFVHLYTDKIWFCDFINKLFCGNYIKLIDGTIIKLSEEEFEKIIYNDYTNINVNLLENFDLDLSLIYEEFSMPNTVLNEIPVEKLDILLDKMGVIIENSKTDKNYIFDIQEIYNFINKCTDEIYDFITNEKLV